MQTAQFSSFCNLSDNVWHRYPKQHYSSQSAIELTPDRYFVELQEEHSDLFV